MKKNIKFKKINSNNCLNGINGNLALKLEETNYEKPKIKKLVLEKKQRPIFMGCWQGSYAEQNGDGC